MTNITDAVESIKDSGTEIAKDVYSDVAHPAAQATGEVVGLIPRAIKAALAPLEKWILQKEYNVAETKKLLEKKLENVAPDVIEPPEAHVAIPAMQYLSYCMDNEELRDMYANLLANSMNAIVKNGVHPGFVEIIKQLCPDEAKILKYMKQEKVLPLISLRYELDSEKGSGGISVIKYFSNVGELVGCEFPDHYNRYFDNIVRLGLLEHSPVFSSITNDEAYKPLIEHPCIVEMMELDRVKQRGFDIPKVTKQYISLTEFGRSFCDICLS